MTSTNDIRSMDKKSLLAQIDKTRQDLFGLRLQNATGELENTARIRIVRRDLARALTVAREQGINVSREMGQ